MAKRKKWLDKDNVNLMVAVCAVLISAASFYATYVQSLAAERQVKAETWPFLQIDHGNYDVERSEHLLSFKVLNAGVGPAHVKSLSFDYRGQPVEDFLGLFKACCIEDGETLQSLRPAFGNTITGRLPPLILPSGESVLVFSWPRPDDHQAIWGRLDAARWHVKGKACYCSLLDECFETDFEADPVPVNYCPVTVAGN